MRSLREAKSPRALLLARYVVSYRLPTVSFCHARFNYGRKGLLRFSIGCSLSCAISAAELRDWQAALSSVNIPLQGKETAPLHKEPQPWLRITIPRLS